jgi:1,4-dihydroxy-2-naphthoate octaprenyltransferase
MKISVKTKIKVHLWTLPRWFALPLFGVPAILGALLAGGLTWNSWIGVIGVCLVMAGGHSFNSLLDYSWTGLDQGAPEERSAEKDYSGGQSVLAAGMVSVRETALNATCWYVLALIPIIYLTLNIGWQVPLIGFLGMMVTFWYARSKFNWTHELTLFIAAGPLAMLAGMYATTGSPPWPIGLVASVPFGILASFIGLAIDEWPDAEANLAKGVKSITYKVWQHGISLEWYLSSWLLFTYLYQIFLISTGILVPLSALSLLTWPVLMAGIVMLKQNFRKWAGVVVLTGVTYPVLIVVGQFLGS